MMASMKLMIGILSTLAEFELNRIKERQKEGIAIAKANEAYPQQIYFSLSILKERGKIMI